MLQLTADKVVMISEQLLCFRSQSRQKHGLQVGAVNALDPTLGEKSAKPACEAVAGGVVVGHFGDQLVVVANVFQVGDNSDEKSQWPIFPESCVMCCSPPTASTKRQMVLKLYAEVSQKTPSLHVV
jgi:hypothetical protein